MQREMRFCPVSLDSGWLWDSFSGVFVDGGVFNYPGTGYLLIQAVRTQDYPLMQGIFLLITFAVLVANLLVDLLYVWLDPRTRGSGHE